MYAHISIREFFQKIPFCEEYYKIFHNFFQHLYEFISSPKLFSLLILIQILLNILNPPPINYHLIDTAVYHFQLGTKNINSSWVFEFFFLTTSNLLNEN